MHHRVENAFFYKGADGARVAGLLDWQMITKGSVTGDIGIFVATSLSPDIAAAHEAELQDHRHPPLYTPCVRACTSGLPIAYPPTPLKRIQLINIAVNRFYNLRSEPHAAHITLNAIIEPYVRVRVRVIYMYAHIALNARIALYV